MFESKAKADEVEVCPSKITEGPNVNVVPETVPTAALTWFDCSKIITNFSVSLGSKAKSVNCTVAVAKV